MGRKIEIVYYLSPHQPGDIKHPEGIRAKQYSYYEDAISSENHDDYWWFKYVNGGSKFADIAEGNPLIERYYKRSFPNGDAKKTGTLGNRNNHNVWDSEQIFDLQQGTDGAVEPRKDNQ